MPTLTVTTRPLADLAADCVVLGATKGEDGAVLAAEAALPTAARAHLEAALADLKVASRVTGTLDVVEGGDETITLAHVFAAQD